MWDPANLIALCQACHLEQHPNWAARLERQTREQQEQAAARKAQKEAMRHPVPTRTTSGDFGEFVGWMLACFCAGAFVLALQQCA